MLDFLFLADFSVIRPEPGLLIWTTIIFGIFWLLMARFAFGPIAKTLRAREETITEALASADNARAEMANLQAENELMLQQAREEKSQILREAKEAKDKIIKDAKEAAKAEANRMIVDAKREIANEKKAALVEVKNKTGQMALAIAEQVLRKELQGDKAQQDYVRTLMDNMTLN